VRSSNLDSLEWVVHYNQSGGCRPGTYQTRLYEYSESSHDYAREGYEPAADRLLQISYTSYYFIPISFGIVLFLNGQKENLTGRFFSFISVSICPISLYPFPCTRARFTIDHLQSVKFQACLSQSQQELLNRLEGIKRDAFRGSYSCNARCTLSCLQVWSKILPDISPIVVSLIFSTVYCGIIMWWMS